MSGQYPAIVYTEEGMREGMQIEDVNIPVAAKVAPPGLDHGPPGSKTSMT